MDRQQTATGDCTIRLASPSVVVIDIRGNADEATAAFLDETLERHLAKGRDVELFFDARYLETYHSEVRTRCVALVQRHRPRIRALNVLVRSRLVRMGVAVANLALGGFVNSFGEVKEFEEAIQAAVNRRR